MAQVHNISKSAGFWLCLVLLGIWSIPETLALRNGLLGVLAAWMAYAIFNRSRLRLQLVDSLQYGYMRIFFVLTMWISLLALLVPLDASRSAGELWSQWWVPVFCGLAGMVTALVFTDVPSPRQSICELLSAIFWLYFGLILLSDLFYLWFFVTQGHWPFRWASLQDTPRMLEAFINGQPFLTGRTGEHGEKLSYLNNTFAALIVAETMHRWRSGGRGIQVSGLWLVLAVLLITLCSYVLRYRNGNVALLVLLSMAALVALLQLRKQVSWPRLVVFTAFIAVFFSGLGYLYWKSDARWLLVQETLPIAWDTTSHQAWLSTAVEPYPKLPDGREVDQSTYERVAWLKEGAALIMEHPIGVGINRTAFSDVLDEKYQLHGVARGKHAHSALIDFTLQNGLAGLLLWLCFSAALIRLGWQVVQSTGKTSGYFLIFLVTGYLGRGLVDSNMKDHMLQQFLFMAAMLAVFSVLDRNNNEPAI